MPLSFHTAGKDCQDSTRFLSKDGSKCSDYDESVCDCSFVECAFADADSACAIECETCDPGLCLCLEFSKHQSIKILIALADCKDNADFKGSLGPCYEYAKDLCQGDQCFHSYCEADGATAIDACPRTCGSCPGKGRGLHFEATVIVHVCVISITLRVYVCACSRG